MKLLAPLVAATLFSTQVAAQQFIVSLGYADFSDGNGEDNVELNLEYHHTPFKEIGRWSLAAGGVLSVDEEGDAFVGAGIASVYDFNDAWFAEFSFMPGLYRDGDDRNDLGNTLEFRSQLAVGRKVSDNAAISLGLQHKSNAGLGDDNPGVNTLSLRYHFSF